MKKERLFQGVSRILILFILGMFFGFYLKGFFVGENYEEEKSMVESEFSCPVTVDIPIYSDLAMASNEVEVVDKPVVIENPELIIMDEVFDEDEFEGGLYSSTEGYNKRGSWSYEEFDVDVDGEDEMIISANVAMNHTPNLAVVVDGGRVIFEAYGANIVIEQIYGGNGFVLRETVDWNIWEAKNTRYIYKNGGFLPVWTQKVCWVRFE